MTPEEAVAEVAAQYDDEEGGLTDSSLRRLQYRRSRSGKLCERCHEHKPLSSFSRDSRNNDGLRGYCRECDADSFRKRVLRKATHVR